MIYIASISEKISGKIRFVRLLSSSSWFFGLTSIALVTAIWGYSNVAMQQAEMTISPNVLLWMRFTFAGILLIPFLVKARLSIRDWVLGLGMGVLLGLSVLAQGFAMLSIPVDEVAFISTLYVVFTPIGVSWLQKKWPPAITWIAVVVSICGVLLLIGHLTLELHVGVLWSFLAALGISGQIIGTTTLTRRMSSVQLTGLQSVGAGAALTISTAIEGLMNPAIFHGVFNWSMTLWIWIAYLSIVATVIACVLQAWGQARISATEAAIAFNMEPVWTAVFAWLILTQHMTFTQMIGAILIISSLTLVSKPKKPRQNVA